MLRPDHPPHSSRQAFMMSGTSFKWIEITKMGKWQWLHYFSEILGAGERGAKWIQEASPWPNPLIQSSWLSVFYLFWTSPASWHLFPHPESCASSLCSCPADHRHLWPTHVFSLEHPVFIGTAFQVWIICQNTKSRSGLDCLWSIWHHCHSYLRPSLNTEGKLGLLCPESLLHMLLC